MIEFYSTEDQAIHILYTGKYSSMHLYSPFT